MKISTKQSVANREFNFLRMQTGNYAETKKRVVVK
jgi:hypothetical protein